VRSVVLVLLANDKVAVAVATSVCKNVVLNFRLALSAKPPLLLLHKHNKRVMVDKE